MTEAEASAKTIATAKRRVGPPFLSATWIGPVSGGALAGLLLVGLYLGLVTWAQDPTHARDLLWGDRYFVAAIATGFGVQVGLFLYVRRLASRRTSGGAVATTAVGTGTSTVAMVACCAHHVTDVLPVLGVSGAAIFLGDYRIPLMAAGLAVNALGVAIMLRLAVVHTRRAREEAAS